MLYYTHVPLTVSRLYKYIIYYFIIIHKHTYFIHHRGSLIITDRPVLLLYHIGVFNNNIFVSLLFIVHRRDVCIFMFFFVCKLLQ